MKLDLSNATDDVLFDVLNDVGAFSVERMGETFRALGVSSVAAGGITFALPDGATCAVHRDAVLNILPEGA